MKLSVAIAAVAASAVAAEQEFCGQWNSTQTGDYTIYNNLWGMDNDKAGGQCTGLDNVDGSTIAWHTSFNWAGDNWQVKSFANAALKFDPVQISNVTSIPTTMEYTYKYDGDIITNVAYDLFTSPTIGGKTAYELMVWLAALGGAWPLTSTGQPIKSVTLGGVDFDLYQGWNNKTKVFTYVAKNMATSFSADLKQFFDELPANNTIETTQYLTHVQAGTEPFQGKNAMMTVTKYSAAVHTA